MPPAKKKRKTSSGASSLSQTIEPRVFPTTRKYEGRWPALLDPNGGKVLRIGVDFGTGNSSAAWVVLDKGRDANLDYIKRVNNLHTQNEQIRFPTVVGVKQQEGNPKRGTLVFAHQATDSLHLGELKVQNLFKYPKLGLIDDLRGIFETDRASIAGLHEKHNRTIKLARKFEVVTAQYPDSPTPTTVEITSVADMINQCLRYFLGLVMVNIAKKLELTLMQVSDVFQMNTEVGFAAPTFWKDAMLDKFLLLIEKAGWPSSARIWSEPKCALAAYVVSNFAGLSESERRVASEDLLNTALVVVDIGAGSLDTSSVQAVEISDTSIRFATIAESGGSLCGGHLLERQIEQKLKKKLGKNIEHIRRMVSENSDSLVTSQDFLESFLYDDCRKNFEAQVVERKYWLRYGGNNLPEDLYDYMSLRAVVLTSDEMIATHDGHLRRVLRHVDEQVRRTQEAVDGTTTKIRVVLIGGVTRAPYIVREIGEHLKAKGLTEVFDIEEASIPLVAVGCILCLGQPALGGRFASKEAYGIPVAETYQRIKHGSNNFWDERTDKGQEARDLAAWIVQVGFPAAQYVKEFEWSFAIYNDEDDSPRITDPRKDPHFSLTMEQQILSTQHPVHGRTPDVFYKNIQSIDERKVLHIELSNDQCMEIHGNSCRDKIGFWKEPATGQWFFICMVRIIVDWPDIKMRWRAEISKTGMFEDGKKNEVWHKEVTFTSGHGHGVKDGDDLVKPDGYLAIESGNDERRSAHGCGRRRRQLA